MATLVSVCGYCASKDQTFDVISYEAISQFGVVLGTKCRRCRKISCLLVEPRNGNASGLISGIPHLPDITSIIHIRERVPLVKDPSAPPHVPDDVAKAYVQAEKLVGAPDMAEPAAVMYGRTVELALSEASKMKGVPLAGTTLVKRIDDAAAKHLLPADLAEWSHEVRQLRNDGAHVNPVDHTEVLELQGFVELLLRYLFTLPGIMAERRLKKNGSPVSVP